MIDNLGKISYIVVDVDGTMTDGGIYYDEYGNETKKFCTKDAAGYHAAKQVGIKILVLTGRECSATTRRLTEMKVDYLIQGVQDKYSYLNQFMQEHNISKEQIAYIGDDVNDIAPMSLVGYIGCPKDSCKEIIAIADYVSKIKGGYGAVRDVIEHVLEERGEWVDAINAIYNGGV